MNPLTITIVQPNHADLQALIVKLDQDLLERYNPEDIYVLDFNDPRIHEVLFVVAYYKGCPVGCGAIRRLDEHSMELKRFFVDEEYRRKGIAKEMLVFLEQKAIESGCGDMKLETGIYQPEAVSFYEKNGYYPIGEFGSYADDPLSLYYEKQLVDA